MEDVELQKGKPEGGQGVDRLLALLAGIIPAVSYYLSLPASIDFGRPGDLAAVVLGADPSTATAGPLWGPWGRTWLAILPTDPTQGLHLISLISIALASVLVYLITSRSVAALSGGRHPGYGSGLIAALSFAWLDTVWSTGTTVAAEAPGLLCGLVGLLLLLRWYRFGASDAAGPPAWYGPAGLVLIVTGGFLTWQTIALLPATALLLWFRYNTRTVDPVMRSRQVAAGLGAALGLLVLWVVAGSLLVPDRENGRVDTDRLSAVAAAWDRSAGSGSGSVEEVATSTIEAGERSPGVRRGIGTFYNRYLLWNLVGRMSSHPEAPSLLCSVTEEERARFLETSGGGPALYYGLPLLLALIGLIRHIRRDWRTALILVTAFLASGPLLAAISPEGLIEVDAFFALSFAFPALWIGIGAGGIAEGLIRAVRESVEDEEEGEGGARGEQMVEREANLRRGALVIAMLLGPVNLIYNGWDLHNRQGVSFAEDFAHNLLLSCDTNGVLLVEGEDFGGLLLYTQASAGVRPDVLVVELERLGSAYYRSIITARAALSGPELDPWEDLPDEGGPGGAHMLRLTLPAVSVDSGDGGGGPRGFDTITWRPTGVLTSSGTSLYTDGLRALERLVAAATPERPIGIAITVDPIWWSGLDRYFVWSGLVYRIASPETLAGYERPTGVSGYPVDRQRMEGLLMGDGGIRLRGAGSGGGEYRPVERRLVQAYRRAWLALAAVDSLGGDSGGGLVEMDRKLPLTLFPMNYWTAAATAMLAKEEGATGLAEKYARHAVERADAIGETWRTDPIARDYNPYQITATMQALLGDYDGAIERYRALSRNPDADPVIRGLIEELRIERYLSTEDTLRAIDELDAIIRGYDGATATGMIENREAWKEYREELSKTDAGDD